jgi:cytochrome c oxidase subunit II
MRTRSRSCGLWLALFLGAAAATAQADEKATGEKAKAEKVIKVTAERFKFTPAVIQLKLGEPVVLELTALDRKHGFQVPELDIDETVEPEKPTRIRLAPGKAGTFLFHCSIFCGSGHEEMSGEIVVKP